MIDRTSARFGASVAALLLASVAWGQSGESSLTLTLDTGKPVKPSTAAPSVPPASRRSGSASAGRTLPPLSTRGSGPARGVFRREVAQPAPRTVLARVGTIIVPRAEIRFSRRPSSALMSVVSQGVNLAVLSESATHYGVLMVNNTLGWIPRDAVQLIDYQTEVALAPERPAATANLDGTGLEPRTQALLREAFSYLGVRYVWAGNTRSGLDCSGFVKNVFSTLGVPLPRHSGDQASVGQPVDWADLQPGDRLYFAMKGGSRINHCGIYLGNGYFIHASSNRGRVDVDTITQSNYYRALVCARRS